MNIKLKQFRTDGGCLSYLLADTQSKDACLIDPVMDYEKEFESYLSQNNYRLKFLIDTHTHADHYSASHALSKKYQAQILMGKGTKSQRASKTLENKDQILISNELKLTVFETPGHTPDSICLYLEYSKSKLLFTGDTLLLGGSGRTDFPGSDPAQLFDSLQKLAQFDANTWVLPGHDYAKLLVSSIGTEKNLNQDMAVSNRLSFIEQKNKDVLECSKAISGIVDFNLKLNPEAIAVQGAHTQCFSPKLSSEIGFTNCTVQDLSTILNTKNADAVLVDVREPHEFQKGHMPNAKNIPLSELIFYWDELTQAKHIYFSCQMGGRSLMASQTFDRLGLKNITNVQGGFVGWVNAGFSVEK